MSRRATGEGLLFISTLLYSTRDLTAAIMSSSLVDWNAELYRAMLQSVGRGPVEWSLISPTGGLVYLA